MVDSFSRMLLVWPSTMSGYGLICPEIGSSFTFLVEFSRYISPGAVKREGFFLLYITSLANV